MPLPQLAAVLRVVVRDISIRTSRISTFPSVHPSRDVLTLPSTTNHGYLCERISHVLDLSLRLGKRDDFRAATGARRQRHLRCSAPRRRRGFEAESGVSGMQEAQTSASDRADPSSPKGPELIVAEMRCGPSALLDLRPVAQTSHANGTQDEPRPFVRIRRWARRCKA